MDEIDATRGSSEKVRDPNVPESYDFIAAPHPRPISTVSLGELFGWFFPGDYLPPDREVHPVAAQCRNDPKYTAIYPDGTCASEREVGHTLYVLCRLTLPLNVIEIGCYNGATSICIAAALKKNGEGQLHCIDISAGSIAFAKENVQRAGLVDQVRFICGNSISSEVVSGLPSASLIFVDGDHTYEGVRGDFEVYQDKLAHFGILAFHDSIKHMEVRKFLAEVAEEEEYDIFTLATSDGDGMSLLRRRREHNVLSETPAFRDPCRC